MCFTLENIQKLQLVQKPWVQETEVILMPMLKDLQVAHRNKVLILTIKDL